MRRTQKWTWVVMVAAAASVGCDKLDTNRTVDSYGSFGEIVYREGCQRVAYTGQLAQKAAGQIQTVDVSGKLGNEGFMAKAPQDVVARTRERLAVAEADIARLESRLATLG